MKELSFNEMEKINGGSDFLDCVSQVTSGLGVLWGAAAALAFGTNPIGLGLLIVGGVGLAASMASNPYACD